MVESLKPNCRFTAGKILFGSNPASSKPASTDTTETTGASVPQIAQLNDYRELPGPTLIAYLDELTLHQERLKRQPSDPSTGAAQLSEAGRQQDYTSQLQTLAEQRLINEELPRIQDLLQSSKGFNEGFMLFTGLLDSINQSRVYQYQISPEMVKKLQDMAQSITFPADLPFRYKEGGEGQIRRSIASITQKAELSPEEKAAKITQALQQPEAAYDTSSPRFRQPANDSRMYSRNRSSGTGFQINRNGSLSPQRPKGLF